MDLGSPKPRATGRLAAGCAALATVGALLGWQFGLYALVFPVAGGLFLAAFPRRARAVAPAGEDALRTHLARARRRGEAAEVFVVRLDRHTDELAARLISCLRVTDSACVIRDGRGVELVAMVDRTRLDRRGLEARLSASAGEPLQIGWARFPEDAYTLAGLLDEARQACRPLDRSTSRARRLALTATDGART